MWEAKRGLKRSGYSFELQCRCCCAVPEWVFVSVSGETKRATKKVYWAYFSIRRCFFLLTPFPHALSSHARFPTLPFSLHVIWCGLPLTGAGACPSAFTTTAFPLLNFEHYKNSLTKDFFFFLHLIIIY